MSDDSTVARTILEQLGRKALFMLGAKSFSHSERALQFRVRGSNVCNTIKIALEPSDTYRVEFWKIRGASMKLVSKAEDVYVDALHATIEKGTGLVTSLGTMGGAS